MLTYVVKKLDAGRKGAAHSVGTKKVRGADGKVVNVHTVDARSETLTDDLMVVFRRNVQRARRENKRVLGVADIAPGK